MATPFVRSSVTSRETLRDDEFVLEFGTHEPLPAAALLEFTLWLQERMREARLLEPDGYLAITALEQGSWRIVFRKINATFNEFSGVMSAAALALVFFPPSTDSPPPQPPIVIVVPDISRISLETRDRFTTVWVEPHNIFPPAPDYRVYRTGYFLKELHSDNLVLICDDGEMLAVSRGNHVEPPLERALNVVLRPPVSGLIHLLEEFAEAD